MSTLRVAVSLTVVNLSLFVTLAVRGARLDAQADGAVLRGRVLELVDEAGRTRSRLNVESDGEVVLRLFDRNGTIRVKLGAGVDGSGLVLLNDETEPSVHLLAKAGGGTVTLRGKGGQERVLAP